MTIDQLRAFKAEYRLTSEMISQGSGVPLGTVQKIFGGATRNPRKQTIEAIQDFFMEEEQRRLRNEISARQVERDAWVEEHYGALPPVLRERAIAYGSPDSVGPYTIDDYYALPDDKRVELIDGKFYDLAAPSMIHQFVLGELYSRFRHCIDTSGMNCEAYMAPCDVLIDRDEYTMVQPDIIVLCDYESPETRYIDGAPDFLVEIMSPSSRMHDQIKKLDKYHDAGVREYWIIDTDSQAVIVHLFEQERYVPRFYDFDDIIPISISQGRCSIDFSEIKNALQKHGWM